MKTRTRKIADCGLQTQSVLECGGWRGTGLTPLSSHATSAAAKAACGLIPHPPQSKTLRQFVALLCFIILHSAFVIRSSGQSYSIDWYKVAGGGGTSTGGTFAVSGTIGQHDAGGSMSGGNYSLTGGFWALISVVQTPGAPTLYISRSGNTVTVFWLNVSGWSLQQNNNLAMPANWSVNSSWTTSNGTNYLNLVSPAGNEFFRLMHP